MSIQHLRNHAAVSAQPDRSNSTHGSGNDFPDHATESVADHPQDQPDLDDFAARMGTDTIDGRESSAARESASTAGRRTSDSGASGDGGESGAWRVSAATVLDKMASGAKSAASGLGSLAQRVTTTDDGVVDLAALRKRVDGIRTVMVTTNDEQGGLSSRPLTVQRVSDDGDVVFVVDGGADWVAPGIDAANIAFVDAGSTWVSVSGSAEVRNDSALLDELWNPLLDAFFPNGRDAAAILEIRADRWEYWTAPNKLTQLVEIVSAKVTDGEPDLGDSGTIET